MKLVKDLTFQIILTCMQLSWYLYRVGCLLTWLEQIFRTCYLLLIYDQYLCSWNFSIFLEGEPYILIYQFRNWPHFSIYISSYTLTWLQKYFRDQNIPIDYTWYKSIYKTKAPPREYSVLLCVLTIIIIYRLYKNYNFIKL